ncbi:kinesin-like protein at 31e [Anaeramoeba flamelloides]|uniref:Kinesin-like protein at 31e n=1 Tax=Anaeramoeba flamelloides TaxID=1746091 RepID=A0ABQ8YN71_9EUKA|nr:kinesin-like protein at 31e [Anaeramoeba flamelloides]
MYLSNPVTEQINNLKTKFLEQKEENQKKEKRRKQKEELYIKKKEELTKKTEEINQLGFDVGQMEEEIHFFLCQYGGISLNQQSTKAKDQKLDLVTSNLRIIEKMWGEYLNPLLRQHTTSLNIIENQILEHTKTNKQQLVNLEKKIELTEEQTKLQSKQLETFKKRSKDTQTDVKKFEQQNTQLEKGLSTLQKSCRNLNSDIEQNLVQISISTRKIQSLQVESSTRQKTIEENNKRVKDMKGFIGYFCLPLKKWELHMIVAERSSPSPIFLEINKSPRAGKLFFVIKTLKYEIGSIILKKDLSQIASINQMKNSSGGFFITLKDKNKINLESNNYKEIITTFKEYIQMISTKSPKKFKKKK